MGVQRESGDKRGRWDGALRWACNRIEWVGKYDDGRGHQPLVQNGVSALAGVRTVMTREEAPGNHGSKGRNVEGSDAVKDGG